MQPLIVGEQIRQGAADFLAPHALGIRPGDVQAAQRDQGVKAAAGGEVAAADLFGKLYYSGNGVVKDRAAAVKWFAQAAASDNSDTMLAMGQLYAAGDGVAKDPEQARQWLEKAKASGGAVQKAAEQELAKLDSKAPVRAAKVGARP